MAKDNSASPSWTDVRASLLKFDRADLQGLIQDLYVTSKDNRAFLHARLGLGSDPLGPYKATISRWINPDLMKGESVSISKAKRAIADYEKAIGRPEGLAELAIFYCEILLRGGVQLRRVLQLREREILCCTDPHVRPVSELRIESAACRATYLR